MGGHDILRASVIAQEISWERERQMLIRQHRNLAKTQTDRQVTNPTWFGGIKATARFLSDAAQEAIAQRRMTEARS